MRRFALVLLAAALAGCGETAPEAEGGGAAETATRAAGPATTTARGAPEDATPAAGPATTTARGTAEDATRAAGPATAARAGAGGPASAAAEPQGRHPTARVLRRTWLRAAPGGRRVAAVGRRTGFGSRHVLAVAGRRGRWVAVHAPERPNGRRGWLPAAAVALGGVDLSVHVDRSARTVTVRDGRRVLRRFGVAVGRPGNATPLGRFGVTDKLLMPAGTPYGCCAVAFSGHQKHLPSGWAGGDRLAVHGTDAPETIGTEASLGCLRAAERDMRWLLRRLPLGAPVIIRA